MTYGGHPYYESFRRRDYLRFVEEIEEHVRKGKKRRKVTGRILEVRVTVETSYSIVVEGVGGARPTVDPHPHPAP